MNRFEPCENCQNVPSLCDECFERIAAPARAQGMPEHLVCQLRSRIYRPSKEALSKMKLIPVKLIDDHALDILAKKREMPKNMQDLLRDLKD